MKYTIIGDLHCTLENKEKVKKVLDLAESYGNPIIILGDLLNNKAIVRSECLNFYYHYFKASKLNYIILVGNHDLQALDRTEHALEPLKALPNVKIVDEAQIIDGMYFIPYIHDLEKFRTTLRYLKGSPILFMHQGVQGFDQGNGHLDDTGITLEELGKPSLVIGGHYHCHSSKDNVVYLGTPFSQSFGETNQEKFIGILDTENADPDLRLCLHPMLDLPRHMTYTINCDCNYMPFGFEIKPTDYNRIILKGKQSNIDLFPRAMFNSFENKVKFIEEPTEVDSNEVISESTDNFSQFETWAKDIKKLDKDTIELGLGILKECL